MSMPLADLIFLAFALSVDAFVVAFSYGLLIKQKRLSNGIKLSLSTGAGQFLMPVLGFLLTGSVHRYIAAWDHWLGFAVFTFPPRGASPRRRHRLHHLPVHGGRLFPDQTAAPLSDLSSGSGSRAHPHRPGRQNAL